MQHRTRVRSVRGLAAVGVVWVAVALAATDAPAPRPTVPAASSGDVAASRLIYLLEYVGADYENAVRDGQVADQFEYGEVLRFTRELQREYGKRPKRSPAVVTGLAELEKKIVARAPAEAVFAASRTLLPKLADSVGGGPQPLAVPSLGNGRRLYESDCAPCHGETGAGDGPASSGMDPPPNAFRGAYLDRLTPRQVYNALTHGIPDTAMPSYATSYDERQRWDVAFFVPTLRVGFAPERPAVEPPPSIVELAASSNEELLARLRTRAPDATPENVDYLRSELQASAPPGIPAPAPAAVAAKPATAGAAAPRDAAAVNVAVQLQDAFSSVADGVFPSVVGVTGYVRDPSWSPEQRTPERGPLWTAAGVDALRYPGFRPIRFGSGFVVDEAGFVLSRDRLLRDDAGELVPLIDVELSDQTHRVANVVGSEPALDLAVLRIAEPTDGAKPPPVAPLGDSDRLATGHWVLALGDPPGAEQNLAVGIVAAPPARQCYQQELSATRVQSSLVVPDRARGGPVVDIGGKVVGITVGESRAGAASASTPAPDPNASHVLPINLVLNLFEALKLAHSTRSPWIGISVLELDRVGERQRDQKAKAALPVNGIGIDDVFVPSPAAAAGVKPGDFLVELGGHAIQSVGDFQKWMYVHGIGAKVELGLLRDGKPLRVTVTIEPRPAAATTS